MKIISNKTNTDENMLIANGRSAKSDKGGRRNEGNLQNCSCCGKLKMTESLASSLLPYQSVPGYQEATLCGDVQISH